MAYFRGFRGQEKRCRYPFLSIYSRSKFSVLGEVFSKICQHISEGFGVEKNDAVVRFSLSIAVQNFEKFVKNVFFVIFAQKVLIYGFFRQFFGIF